MGRLLAFGTKDIEAVDFVKMPRSMKNVRHVRFVGSAVYALTKDNKVATTSTGMGRHAVLPSERCVVLVEMLHAWGLVSKASLRKYKMHVYLTEKKRQRKNDIHVLNETCKRLGIKTPTVKEQ